jgi:hypothetical protein
MTTNVGEAIESLRKTLDTSYSLLRPLVASNEELKQMQELAMARKRQDELFRKEREWLRKAQTKQYVQQPSMLDTSLKPVVIDRSVANAQLNFSGAARPTKFKPSSLL